MRYGPNTLFTVGVDRASLFSGPIRLCVFDNSWQDVHRILSFCSVPILIAPQLCLHDVANCLHEPNFAAPYIVIIT